MDEELKPRFKVKWRLECNICGWTPNEYECENEICPLCGGNIQYMRRYWLCD